MQRLPGASQDQQHLQPAGSDGGLIDSVWGGGGVWGGGAHFVPSSLALRVLHPEQLNEMFTWSWVWEQNPYDAL